MARLVKLPSGRVFREEMEKPDIYRRPKDMFGMNALSQAIDFADKVAKSEGVGALMNVGEKIYDKYAEGDTTEAVQAQADAGSLLKKAAEAKAGPPPTQRETPLQPKTPLAVATEQPQKRPPLPADDALVRRLLGVPTSGVPMVAVPEAYKLSEEARRQTMAPLAVKEDDAEAAARDARLKQLYTEVAAGKVQGTTEVGQDQGEFVGPQKDFLNKVYKIVEGQKPAGGPAGGPAAPAAPQPPPETPVDDLVKQQMAAQAAADKAAQDKAAADAAAKAAADAAAKVAAQGGVPQGQPIPVAPPATTGTSTAAARPETPTQPQAPAGPTSRPTTPVQGKTAEPVPAGQPGETPVAPVGEGTPKAAETTTKEQARQNAVQTVEQGLDFIQNEFARNSERAAATIDLTGAALVKSPDAMTDADILRLLIQAATRFEPTDPRKLPPLNIPNKLSIQQLIGYARQAQNTQQQQQVLEAFTNKLVTGMYAPTLASRLTGDYKKPWLDAVIASFPSRSTPAQMHPVDAMYKTAAAIGVFRKGEKTKEEIEAGLPEAKAFATRAGGMKDLGLAQQAAEKATEIRELLQAERALKLANAQKALQEAIKPPKKGGGAGGDGPVDIERLKRGVIDPTQKDLDRVRARIEKDKEKLADLKGRLAAEQQLASDPRYYPAKSQAAQKKAEAKANVERYKAQIALIEVEIDELTKDEEEYAKVVADAQATYTANLGKKQPKVYTAEEGKSRFLSPAAQAGEAAKTEVEAGKVTKPTEKVKATPGLPARASIPKSAARTDAAKLMKQRVEAGQPQEGDRSVDPSTKRPIIFKSGRWVYIAQ